MRSSSSSPAAWAISAARRWWRCCWAKSKSVGSIWFRPVEVQVFALFLVIAILVYRSRGKAAPMLYRPHRRSSARRSGDPDAQHVRGTDGRRC